MEERKQPSEQKLAVSVVVVFVGRRRRQWQHTQNTQIIRKGCGRGDDNDDDDVPSSMRHEQYSLQTNGKKRATNSLCILDGSVMDVSLPYVRGLLHSKYVTELKKDLSTVGNSKSCLYASHVACAVQ
jgi:hypothetical protein